MKVKIELDEFFSSGDEKRFFEGLAGLHGVQRIVGSGRGLIITLNLRRLNQESLIDLIALLWRYKIPLQPLHEIAKNTRFGWLSETQWYWHSSMFEKTRG